MMTGAVRWLMVMALSSTLGGCAYPTFNNDTWDTRVRAVTFDQRFPLLKAYQECTVDGPSSIATCDKAGTVADYTFVHFDEHAKEASEIITRHDTTRIFKGAANLLPSFSLHPSIRTMDTFGFNSRSHYQQFVAFYRSGADPAGHRLLVELPRRTCPDEDKTAAPTQVADLWQPVKFVVVVEGRATIFVEMAATKQVCHGMRVKDVLGDIVGIPADLADRPYLVYTADVAQSRDGTVVAERVTISSCSAEMPAAGGQKSPGCMKRSANTVLERDPVANISMDAATPSFVCREHTTSTDWTEYLGMVAHVPGKISYSKRCRPVGL